MLVPVSIAMVALIFAVVAAVTVPGVSIVATIVVIAVAIFKYLATLFTPVIRLTSVVATVVVVEMTFAYRAAPVAIVCVLHTEPEARVNVAVPDCVQNRTVLNTTEQPWEEP